MPDVTLHLDQPAALGRGPRGTAPVDTYRYVPGTTLRGALAQAWLRDHGQLRDVSAERRAEFLRLFEGSVRFGPLFDPTSDVVPLSVLRCKYQPEPGCRTFTFDEAQQTKEPATRPRCDVCCGRTEPGRGEVEFFGPNAQDQIVQTTRVQLTEDEQADEGKLFTRRALSARPGGRPRTLTGRIVVPDDVEAPWLLDEHRLFLGARKSTSGAARYRAADTEPAAPDPAVLLKDNLLEVRLIGPALFVDPAGRPVDLPDTDQLAELLGLDGESTVVVERSWKRREQIGGRNYVTALPKPVELAVSAGSVFRLRLNATPTAAGLARLIDHGLGLRRAEGFGSIALGPWTPRPLAEPDGATASVAPSHADQLAQDIDRLTDETAWFHGQLHDCLLGRRGGGEADLGFLNKPRAEVLGRLGDVGKLREQIVWIAKGDVRELERLVVCLESYRRKETLR